MDFVLVTQRSQRLDSINETRDALDRNWHHFLFEVGVLPFVLPNEVTLVKALLSSFKGKIVGTLLTGGNSLQVCQGDSPERDELEQFLLQYSLQHDLPVLGVCRGMQVLLDHFGGELTPVEGQVQASQKITINGESADKNSYHDWACLTVPNAFRIFAHSAEHLAKGVQHKSLDLTGIMWHPERLLPFHADDIALFRKVFKQ